MVEHNNIINFYNSRKAAPGKNFADLPQIVISAQRRCKHHLKVILPKFFTQLDDRLFELAEKAHNNQEQTLYFDAMREMRRQTDDIKTHFFSAFEQGFYASLQSSQAVTGGTQGLDNIALLGDDQLEISLAVNTMADNANNLYSGLLHALTARLDFLIEDIEITKKNNPLRPETLCIAFAHSMEGVTSDINIKLLCFKVFEHSVIIKLANMYQAINDDFIAAGVLPRIKTTIIKSSEDHRSRLRDDEKQTCAASSVSQQETEAHQDSDLFSALQQLLHCQRNTPPGQRQPSISNTTSHRTADHSPAQYYPAKEILSALSKLQSQHLPDFQGEADEASAELIKARLVELISQDGNPRQINQTDIDTIDIVSMLFDFILDDPGISNHIKAQIARLQIPLLKVAIQDKAFFAQKSHPARQLLNELAYASNSLDDKDIENDATYQMVKHSIEQIVSHYERDMAIFTRQLQALREFVASEREANRQAEELLLEARDSVAREIQQRISNNRVAPLINHILMTAWKEVLVHLYLRDGKQSIAWQTALRVADDLIWSVQPKLLLNERQKLIKTIPGILNGLRDGLTLIRYDRGASEQIFSGLETLHLTSIRGGDLESVHHDANTTHQPELLSEEDFGIDISSLPDTQHDILMEESVLSSSQAWDAESTDTGQQNAPLRDMALGTWVEFIDAQSEQRKRGKLAWKCDFTGDYTFVDRRFKVVADLNQARLLQEFQLGRARIIEDVPLFDRALDSVFGGIKQALQGHTEDRH